MWRIGHGFDVHPFDATRPLWLGGVAVSEGPGLAGHSDADVVLHALCDALLGAVALGDIGSLFPDTDSQWAGRESSFFLQQVISRVQACGYGLHNADITIIAQKPRLAAYRPAMQAAIATCCGVPQSCINVKATTTEKLGALGRGEGIAAEAVVLLQGVE